LIPDVDFSEVNGIPGGLQEDEMTIPFRLDERVGHLEMDQDSPLLPAVRPLGPYDSS